MFTTSRVILPALPVVMLLVLCSVVPQVGRGMLLSAAFSTASHSGIVPLPSVREDASPAAHGVLNSGLPHRVLIDASSARDSTVVPGLLWLRLHAAALSAPGMTAAGRTGAAAVDRVLADAGVSELRSPFSFIGSRAQHVAGSAASPHPLSRVLLARIGGGMSVHEVARRLTALPEVDIAEPVRRYRFLHVPSDPRLPLQWAVAMLRLPEAWDVTRGDSTISIGVVDSGVDWGHEDLAAGMAVNEGEWGMAGELASNGVDDDGNGFVDDWRGWDFIGQGTVHAPHPDNDASDNATGHGSGVAGCAVAVTDNGIGIAGSGYRTRMLPVKVGGDGAQEYAEAGPQGIAYAASRGCRVILCAWGAPGPRSRVLDEALAYAESRGALVIAAAGNTSRDLDREPYWPASHPGVLAVSSIDRSGEPSSWSAAGTAVDVWAPGENILTTRAGGEYELRTGSSYAAALAAGCAALVFSARPQWTPRQVLAQLRASSTAFAGGRDAERYGRLDAATAVTMNAALGERPGLTLVSSQLITSAGVLSRPGQPFSIVVTLRNMLAPTVSDPRILVEPGDSLLLVTSTEFRPGLLGTFDSVALRIEGRLSDTPQLSEGHAVLRLRIEAGGDPDWVAIPVPLALEQGWHTVFDAGLPAFTSLSAPMDSVVWAAADIVQSQSFCFRSTDAGATWRASDGTGFPPRGVYVVHARDSLTAFVGTTPGTGTARLVRTRDGGATWSDVTMSVSTSSILYVHLFDANDGVCIGQPRDGRWIIARTSDGGATWTGLPDAPATLLGGGGWPNAGDAVGDVVWFGTNRGRVFRSTDRGRSWMPFSTPGSNVVQLSFRNAAAGVARFQSQGGSGENLLAVTRDSGTTWTALRSIGIDRLSSAFYERGSGRLWLLQRGTALVSHDDGGSWTAFPRPRDFEPITAAATWSGAGRTHAYAAGYDVFRCDGTGAATNGVSAPVHPVAFIDAVVYPHPALSGQPAVLELRMPRTSPVRIDVHDLLGRSVLHVLDAVLRDGVHGITLRLEKLPPGAYLVRIDAGGTRRSLPVRISGVR